jgi:hypothetical protein
VTELQTALQKDGESVTVSGTFDDRTASAVTAFQEKYQSQILAPYGLTYGTGYAGKSTRAELNSLFGCSGSNPVTPPIVVNPITSTSTPPIIVNPVGPAPVVPPVSTVQNVSVAPTSLSFTLPQNGTTSEDVAITAPAGVTYSVTSNPSAFNPNSWIALSYAYNCGSTACGNESVYVSIVAYNGLAVGTYNGSIMISGNFSGSPETIPVTLTVTSSGSTVSTSTSWNNIVVNPLSTLSINVSTNGQGSLTLSWPAATSTNGIALYNVYRGTQDLFTLSSSSFIGQVNALSYTDSNLANGVYYYAVVPQDVSGKTALPTYTHSSVTNVAPPAGSTFTIQADPGNPAATQVSTGATGVTLLRFDITNPLNHPLRITQLPGLQEVASPSTQQPVGESSPDFNSVSLYSMATGQNVLVGTFPSFSSSQTPGAFWNSTMYLSGLTIPANTTQEFTITGNVPSYTSGAANVGTEGGILLSGSNIVAIDGVTNASISGSGTAAGNPITITQGQ